MNMPRSLWIDFVKIPYSFLVRQWFILALRHFSCVLKGDIAISILNPQCCAAWQYKQRVQVTKL